MSSSQIPDATSRPQPGRVTRALLKWLMRPAYIAAVDQLSPHFRLIDLKGDALKDVSWAVGQKIQIAMGAGLTARTYTPILWDAEGVGARLLAFAHGDGPGSLWASTLQAGDTCQFFGPRRSLDLSGLEAPIILFGDETSFALGAALRNMPQSARITCVFEASASTEALPVLEAIGLGDAVLIERLPEDGHLAAAEAEVVRHASGGGAFILTGKASSIQRISRALKAAGVGSSRMNVKAYWAPGKRGMD